MTLGIFSHALITRVPRHQKQTWQALGQLIGRIHRAYPELGRCLLANKTLTHIITISQATFDHFEHMGRVHTLLDHRQRVQRVIGLAGLALNALHDGRLASRLGRSIGRGRRLATLGRHQTRFAQRRLGKRAKRVASNGIDLMLFAHYHHTLCHTEHVVHTRRTLALCQSGSKFVD
ncbi:hypothetical protein BpHYR1_053532 [Brachionus plicatilis]|uniref:Uncharacterized protein n=1 Tax=Brachionus plicatilis TaxID=10195 RepID=A0A3M7PE18_BRAPC|nr:hypothetical protein BpHYR1_053532 [Brachionus plicatilis]